MAVTAATPSFARSGRHVAAGIVGFAAGAAIGAPWPAPTAAITTASRTVTPMDRGYAYEPGYAYESG